MGFETGAPFLFLFLLTSTISLTNVHSHSPSDDADAMHALKHSLDSLSQLDWSDPNPCRWDHVACSKDNRVTRIQVGNRNLKGLLPQNLNNLTKLKVLELQNNQLTGPLPSLSGLTQLQNLLIHNNNFSSIPTDFFNGMSSLLTVYLDYNAFTSWSIPDSLKTASRLQIFSATSTNLAGKIPNFFGADIFAGLVTLRLSYNYLEGGLPDSFSGSMIQNLRLNGQKSNSRLNGSIQVLENMTYLTEVWLHGNSFSGQIPDFSGLGQLRSLSLRDNSFTGPVPLSLTGLKSLKVVNLTNNMFQGPMPKFDDSVAVDMIGINSFCLHDPGVGCDSRVDVLLAVAESVGYPQVFAEKWLGNDPCDMWLGVTCLSNGDITVVNFRNMGLVGSISSNFSSIGSLQRLILADNNLTGVIPDELKDLPNLVEIDVSNNQLYGKVPIFKQNVKVESGGNPNIGKNGPIVTTVAPSGGNQTTVGDGGGPSVTPVAPSRGNQTTGGNGGGGGHLNGGMVVGCVVGGVCVALLIGLLAFCFFKVKTKRSASLVNQSTMMVHPRHPGSDGDEVKITIASSSKNNGSQKINDVPQSSGTSNIHKIKAGNTVISIQVLDKE